jgi:hypothetical protein
MMTDKSACKYWDCGWCYAPNYLKTNAINSTCVNPYECPISPLSEPVQYETPMTEIEELKAQIKVLEAKLSLLEEIEKQPRMNLQQEGEYAVVSYHDKVYYRLMGETTFSWYIKKGVSVTHPVPTLVMVTDAETERLLEGIYYNHIQVKKEKEQQTKSPVEEAYKDWWGQYPELETDGDFDVTLKEAFREAVKQGVVSSSTKPQTLTDLIADWWADVFTTGSDWDGEICIDNLVEQIKHWLPKEQSASGSQNAYVECSVEGYNDCINKIRRKLK